MTQIIVEVDRGVLIIHLDREDAQTVHPGDETREHGLTTTGHTDEEHMALWLAEHTINAQNIFLFIKKR